MVDSKTSEGEKTVRILHVDDDPSILEISKQILMDIDSFLEIDHAHCVEEAFKKIANRNYDLIISDYEMPQKNGLHFLRELREQNNEIPFILFTGKGKEDVAIEALNLGSDGYVNKQGNSETVYGELSHLLHLSLERSRSKLQKAKDALALQTVEDAIITTDQDLIIASWNKAAEEVFACPQNEAIGKKIEDIFAPMKLDVSLQEISLALKEKGRFNAEVSYIDKKGILRYGELTIINQVNKASRTLGYTIVCHDISEKKEMEDSIQQKLCMLESIAENMGAGFVTIDKDYRVQYANRFVKNNCGNVEGQLCYATLNNLEHICPDCGAIKVFEGKVTRDSHEYSQIGINGKPYFVEIIATPIKNKNGNIIAVMEFVVDIAEKKQLEQKLLANEAKSRAISDSALDAIFMFDEEDKINYWNPAAERIFGYTGKEIIGQTVNEKLIPVRLRKEHLKSISEIGKGKNEKNASIPLEYSARRKDGVEFPMELSIAPMHLNDNLGFVAIARDVTERKQVEAALKKSEEKYRLLADSLPEIVFETDNIGKLIYVNERAFELTGYTQLDVEKGLFAFDFFDQKDKQRGKENFSKVLSNNISRNNEYTFIKKDGSTFPVLVSSTPVILDNKIVGLRGLLIDITQRKNIEEALRLNEEKFRTLAEKSSNMIFINYQGRVVYANKKCEDFMGYTREEFYSPNFSFLSLCAPEYAELLKSNFVKHSRGEDIDPYEYVLVTRNGNRLNAIISSKLIDYQGGKAILGIITDITQLKQTEEEIRISEEKYRSLFENASDVILTGDLSGKISSINVAIEKYGFKKEQLIGRNIREFLSIEDSFRQDKVFQEVGLGKTLSNTLKVDTPLKNAIFEIKTDPLRTNGIVVGFQTILRDVTEHCKHEADLKINRDRLELMNEKLRVVGSLTRHDVGNKLSIVTGNAYLLKKKYPDQTDVVEGIQKIEQAVKESLKIFDFARIYAQLGVEELKYVDVENSLNEALSLFSGLNLIVINDCHGLNLFADSFLVQLFCNLIDNTRKHGVKATKIRVFYEKTDSGELNLIYEDDGVGISAENKRRLFSEGFSTGGSSGFGLFLIKKMIGVYGWIMAETGEPGKGVKFIITIPNKNKSNQANYIYN